MISIDAVINQIKQEEDYKQFAYKDTKGILTIGYGRNIQDVGISESEASFLLINDIHNATYNLFKNLPWIENLTSNRQIVLIDMTFNLGIDGLLEFKNMLAYCKAGDYAKASEEMKNSAWYSEVKSRAVKLCDMMLNG